MTFPELLTCCLFVTQLQPADFTDFSLFYALAILEIRPNGVNNVCPYPFQFQDNTRFCDVTEAETDPITYC